MTRGWRARGYEVAVGLALFVVSAMAARAIEHRFLAIDESRGQLHLVDQRNTNQSWTLKLPERCRDYQLIGSNELLLSSTTGYYVCSLTTRALVKQLHDQRFEGIAFADERPPQQLLSFAQHARLLVSNRRLFLEQDLALGPRQFSQPGVGDQQGFGKASLPAQVANFSEIVHLREAMELDSRQARGIVGDENPQ